jgi:glucose-6-phosphate 1-epimerase
MNVLSLNQIYGIAGSLEFTEGKGGLPVAKIITPQGEAAVSLYGAHVLSYRPSGKEEVLWMSEKSEFAEGKAIRGGIPVCFPWFGKHASDPKKPQHGFARLTMWRVAGASKLTDGSVELRLAMSDTPSTRELWPHPFAAELVVTVGGALRVELRCTNTGTEAFTYSDALHSYFRVSDCANVKVEGLGGVTYYDAGDDAPKTQTEKLLEIRGEVNRRYMETDAECVIEDSGFKRTIRVGKQNSHTTVVWNPWSETAAKMADMADDGYRTMLCVEAVNAFEDSPAVPPGGTTSLETIIAAEERP